MTIPPDHGRRVRVRPTLIATAVAASLAATLAPRAQAQTASSQEVQELRDEVRQLRQEMERMRQQQGQSQAPQAAPQQPPAAAAPQGAAPSPPVAVPSPQPATGSGPSPAFMAGPVKVTFGGFVELMVVNRDRNESADWASNYNTAIPYPNSHNYYLSEFHLTERQSRAQALVQGPDSESWATEGYLETDFGAAPATGNNNESTSFSPRVRHFFADVTYKDTGTNLLFGQTWSLVTGFKQGMTPRQENIPLTIDGQYVPGFDWLRLPQIRLTEKFNDAFAAGISFENPAAQVTNGTSAGAPALTTMFNNPGASNSFITTNNVTLDYLPDIVAKVAFDPGWGHYELFGVQRFFRTRDLTKGDLHNVRTSGTGYGANLILPLVPKIVDFQASLLAGRGMGRYGSAQLPDATLNPRSLGLEPLRSFQALVGLAVRPLPMWTLYGYAGEEQVSRWDQFVQVGTKAYDYGYGGSLFDNSGCEVEGGSACASNTSRIVSGTLGGWWKFYQGYLGNAQIGLSDTWIKREIFSGIGGDPNTNINITMVSFRYYPFQK